MVRRRTQQGAVAFYEIDFAAASIACARLSNWTGEQSFSIFLSDIVLSPFSLCAPSEIGRYLAEKGAITFKREERDGAIVLTAEAKYIASQDAYGPDCVMPNRII